MRGALKLTYVDGTEEYYEVDPVGDNPRIAERLQAFLASPNVTLIMDGEILIIPSTSIRHISLTRSDAELPEDKLQEIPGVVVGAKRIVA